MNKILTYLFFLTIPLLITGCELTGDLFKSPVWIGIIIITAFAAVIAFVIKLFTK